MSYIYDILLNFKDELYDFYEWNKNDNIIHVRKIPIIKISSNDLLNIKNNNVVIDLDFLERIRNKTEVFTSKNTKNIEYACLLTDGSYIMGISKQNKIIKKSSLLLDEEMDSLEEIENEEIKEINYRILSKMNIDTFKTRKQLEIEVYLKKEIEKIKNQDEKLKYIYYECFNEKEDLIDKIIIKLYDAINDYKISNKLYKFFKMMQVNK